MKSRRSFERQLQSSAQVSNFRIAIAIKSFILVLGILIITNSKSGTSLGAAIIVIAYEVIAAWVAQSRFALGVLMVVILNFAFSLLLLADILKYGRWNDSLEVLWMVCTGAIAITGVILLVVASLTDSRKVTEY